VHTLIVDQKKRVRLPEAKPGQVFSLEPQGDGSLVLIPLKKPKRKEMFPPGSLLKYMTKERDELQAELLKGCLLEPQ
jgi:hypothetical protein